MHGIKIKSKDQHINMKLFFQASLSSAVKYLHYFYNYYPLKTYPAFVIPYSKKIHWKRRFLVRAPETELQGQTGRHSSELQQSVPDRVWVDKRKAAEEIAGIRY